MRVEIWSDVVCPWCYIGKRRFEAALSRFPHADQVDLIWRSFELDPAAPPSTRPGGSYVQQLATKYGIPLEQAQSMIDNLIEVAASEGLTFRFDLSQRGNTFDAHRLLHLALAEGLQDDLKERLDHETFTQGLAVSDRSALAGVAAEVGLDETEVTEVLASDRFADAVREDEAQARAYGISAVPFFVIDGRYGVEGAQPSQTLLEVLTGAWEERSAPTLDTESPAGGAT